MRYIANLQGKGKQDGSYPYVVLIQTGLLFQVWLSIPHVT